MTPLPAGLNFASVGFALPLRFPHPCILPRSFEHFELHQMEQFRPVVRIDTAVFSSKSLEAEQDSGDGEDIMWHWIDATVKLL